MQFGQASTYLVPEQGNMKRNMKRLASLSVVLVLALLGLNIPYLVSTRSVSADTPTLTFAGYTWEIRDYSGLPGPDSYTASNAWVDGNGYLHLKITDVDGVWECAEVRTLNSLGFGTYTFDVQSSVNNLDQNVVLGLFTHEMVNTPGVNEIDIEYSEWGNSYSLFPLFNNGKYTVFPAQSGLPTSDSRYSVYESGSTVNSFTWSSTGVSFQSLYSGGSQLASWDYSPTDYLVRVPQDCSASHAYMDLWLYNNQPPSNYGQGGYVDPEIVITGFSFTAAAQVETATHSGTAGLTPAMGTIENLTAVSESNLPALPPEVTQGKLKFPDGFFQFNVTGLTSGQSGTLTITLPSAVPDDAQYWKYGPTLSDSNPHWYRIPWTRISSNIISIKLTDGGLGDDDLTHNGVIVDPGGLGDPPSPSGGSAHSAPVFPSIYVGLGAALGAGIAAYAVRKRLAAR